MKEETELETSAAVKYCNENHKGGARTYRKCYESFIAGSQWQQSQQVSDDEKTLGIICKLLNDIRTGKLDLGGASVYYPYVKKWLTNN